MTELDICKIAETVADSKELTERAAKMKTPEEFVALAQEANVIISLDDARAAMEQAQNKLESNELSEDDLEMVNGGFAVAATLTLLVIAGCVLLAATLVYLGLFVYTVNKRNSRKK